MFFSFSFKTMDAGIKLSDWSPETTEARKYPAERASLDLTFRDLSYTVGEGKIKCYSHAIH